MSARTVARPRAALATALLAGALTVGAGALPSQAVTAPTAATPSPVLTYSLQKQVMTVQDTTIKEASGITRSTWPSSRMWVHNDSGDTNRVFAIGTDGQTRATVTLSGAKAHDWEDIAAGPDHTLWVGDIGNNGGARAEVQVISFQEPEKLATQTVASQTYTLGYPDKRWDAEALMVDPQTGQVYVVTKSRDGGGIYRAPNPLVAGATNTMTRVGSVPDRITGADFAPDGSSFVIRNYETAYVYSGIGATPTVIALPHQRQGESIGYNRAGTALMIGSEGKQQPVWQLTN